MLASLEDVKRKLDLPVTDESRDEGILLVLGAATVRLLDWTRYQEDTQTGRVDTLRRVRQGVEILLPKRPVAAVTLAQGRVLGGTVWTTLTADLVDPEQGTIVIVRTDEWPPKPSQSAAYRWREYVWPIVKVTYNVTGVGEEETVADDLRDLCAELTHYWYRRHLAGAAEEVTIGPLREKLMKEAVPDWLRPHLAAHTRGGSARWV